jgi:flavorubredoxin
MASITEIAPDVYRISHYEPDFDLQFNHFVVKDDEPLLYHTGMMGTFPVVRDAVAKIIEPSRVRWIAFSHFEVDECGSLNEWLQVAPSAQTVCTVVGALVNLNDFSSRPPLGVNKGDRLKTGKYRFRIIPTPHLPHAWDAGHLFEEVNQTLFCSDLFHQIGNGRARDALISYQTTPLMNYMPYTPNTERFLAELGALKPKTLATMHGSTFVGNGEQACLDLTIVMKEVLAG